MRRRDFLKYLGLSPLIGSINLPKKEVDYHSHKIVAKAEHIKWSGIDEPDKFDAFDWINIPTNDTCEDLMIGHFEGEDCIYWIGKREIWVIEYIGDPDLPFRIKFLGQRIDLEGRIGYSQFGIKA